MSDSKQKLSDVAAPVVITALPSHDLQQITCRELRLPRVLSGTKIDMRTDIYC